MQPTEAFPQGDWDLTSIFSMEEPEFSTKLLGQFSLPLEHDEGQHLTVPLAFCPNLEGNASMAGFDESPFFSWKTARNSNFNFLCQEISNSNKCSGCAILPVSFNHETFFSSDTMSMDISTMDGKSASSFLPVFTDEFVMAENACNNEDITSNKMSDLDGGPTINVVAKELQLKRKFDIAPEPIAAPMGNPQKISRPTNEARKSTKKRQKVKTSNNGNDEEMSNGGPAGRNTTTSYCSEDDNVSQGSTGGASSDSKVSETLNSSGKTRAGRGSASDPQSLYARRRRERINERVRILQNLVPSGTKVDISTMLEEAVHYVKFLQHQIKLLSSDELWMFAPLAYNGIDIGLGQNHSMLL